MKIPVKDSKNAWGRSNLFNLTASFVPGRGLEQYIIADITPDKKRKVRFMGHKKAKIYNPLHGLTALNKLTKRMLR